MLVEDDAPIREVVMEALVEEGFEVVAAETGEQALKSCREKPLDALVTDIRLPGKISGWDVAEICREADPTLPVIYAPGNSHPQPRPVSGSVLFHKPYRPKEIVSAIRKLTSQRGGR